ncbi:Ig-like domain-containing protein, partial [Crocosphaera watsonii]
VTPPLISASLVEDTGSSDNDFLTNNPTISGTVEDISLITEFKAGFDDALEADFVDVLGQLQEDGSFNFDAAIIQEINNNTELSQGEHTLKLTATDVVGNKAETFEFTFILDSENPDLIINTPVDDGFINGRSNLTGNLEGTGSGLASLSYRFDQGELIEVTVDENGNFDQRFDVTGLSFDEHSLTLIATDEAGNITEETVNVTVQELTSLRVT